MEWRQALGKGKDAAADADASHGRRAQLAPGLRSSDTASNAETRQRLAGALSASNARLGVFTETEPIFYYH